jgi:serine/threonine protein kinase
VLGLDSVLDCQRDVCWTSTRSLLLRGWLQTSKTTTCTGVRVSQPLQGVAGQPDPLSELEAVRTALASEYDVLEELGRGGMAAVYLAHDRQLDRKIALKVLPRSLILDSAFVERFQREGRIAAQLEHPHIVPIYRVGREGDVIYLAMKHLRGGSLASLLKRQGKLSPAEVRRVLLQVGEALDCAWSRQIVHRDIKPENILFDEVGRCVVTDFGIAKSGAEHQLTGAGQSIGTPHYMSPEQARGIGTDVRSDLYSLGVVAYHCFAGKVPFDASDNMAILYAHVTKTLPTPALPTAEHESLYRIIQRLMAKNPAERIQSGRELLNALKGESPSQSPSATAEVDRLPSALWMRVDLVKESLATTGLVFLRHCRDFWLKRQRNPRAAAITSAAILVVLMGAYAMSGPGSARSLCPSGSEVSATNDSKSAQSTPAPFILLMDPVPQHVAGSELEVHYDVCGLPPGTPYRGRLRLSKQGDLLKKVFGDKSKPLVVAFQDRVDGPATRRHRNLDLDSTRPGSYTLELSVLDNRGRERKRLQTVLVTTQ